MSQKQRQTLAQPLAKRRRIWPMLLVFLVLTAIASPLLASAQSLLGLGSDVLSLPQVATLFGALAVLIIWRQLPKSKTQPNSWKPAITASVAAVVSVAIVLVAARLLEIGSWNVLDPSILSAPLLVVLLMQLFGAASEEIGWRGIVQPALESKMKVLPATLITGLLFGAGHIHILAAGPAVYGIFIIAAIALSVVLAVGTVGLTTKWRVIVATIVHWLVNIILLIGFSGGDTSIAWMMTFATALIAGAATTILFKNQLQKKSI